MRRLQASELSDSEVRRVLDVRDRLLHLYAPARYSEPKARVWVGVDSQYTYETGTRHWREKRSDRRTVRWPEDIPYLVVDDPEDPDWMPSLQAWCDHVSGFTSLLPRWDREDGLTSVLIDVDHPWFRHGLPEESDVFGWVRPLVVGIESIEAHSGVRLPIELMWTGNTGIWIHLHMAEPVSHRTAAEFALLVGSRRLVELPEEYRELCGRYGDPSKRNVCVNEQVLDRSGDPEGWRRLFRRTPKTMRAMTGVFATIDGGNIVTRPCRLPLASHQTTLRPAVFVDREGRVLDDQIGHLMSIERREVDLEAVVAACRPPSVRVAMGGDGAGTSGSAAGELDVRDGAGLEGADDAGGRGCTNKVTSGSADATSESGAAPVRQKQWATKVRNLISGGVEGIPLDVIIPPLHDGHTNETLVPGKVLDRVYAWFRLNRGPEFTVGDVLRALRPHYVDMDKTEEVRRVVQRDFDNGRHLIVNPDRIPHPCVARCVRAAESVGLDLGSRQFLVLVYLAYKAWRHDAEATITALEIAKSLELVDMDCVEHDAREVMMGRDLAKLQDIGLIERTKWGSPHNYSAFEIRFPLGDEDGEGAAGETAAPDPGAGSDEAPVGRDHPPEGPLR